MARSTRDAIRVQGGRQALREHLALQHRGTSCPRDLGSQLDLRGFWTKRLYARSHILGEVAWRWTCAICKATTIVVSE